MGNKRTCAVASSGDTVTAEPSAAGIGAPAGSPDKGITAEVVRKHTLDCLTLKSGDLGTLLAEAAALPPEYEWERGSIPFISHEKLVRRAIIFNNRFNKDFDPQLAEPISCDKEEVPAGSSPPAAAAIAHEEKTPPGKKVAKTAKAASSPPAAAAIAHEEKMPPVKQVAEKAKAGASLPAAAAIAPKEKKPPAKEVATTATAGDSPPPAAAIAPIGEKPPGDKVVKKAAEGFIPPAAAAIVPKRKWVPGVKAKEKDAKYMTLASKADPPSPPDGETPPTDVVTRPGEFEISFGGQAALDLVTAGVKAMVAAGATQTFQQYLESLSRADRDVLCQSYLHYLAANECWNSQIPGRCIGKKGVGKLSGILLVGSGAVMHSRRKWIGCRWPASTELGLTTGLRPESPPTRYIAPQARQILYGRLFTLPTRRIRST